MKKNIILALFAVMCIGSAQAGLSDERAFARFMIGQYAGIEADMRIALDIAHKGAFAINTPNDRSKMLRAIESMAQSVNYQFLEMKYNNRAVEFSSDMHGANSRGKYLARDPRYVYTIQALDEICAMTNNDVEQFYKIYQLLIYMQINLENETRLWTEIAG